MPYEAPAESFGSFPTSHYVKKYKGYMPTSKPKAKAMSVSRSKNVIRQEAKRCMQRLAEKKHLSTAISHNPIAAAGSLDTGVVMSQGTSATTRTGNQVHISEISVEGLHFLATNVAADDARFIIGWDRQPDGAALTVAQVLEAANPQSVYNRDLVKAGGRVTILYDKHVGLNQPNAGAAIGGSLMPLRFRKKVDTVVYYQSNAGTISDLLKNNLFVLQISTNGIIQFTGNIQVCFTDL